MWFQARQEEKKLRNIMIDHKKRVDRRKMFYEKIKKDPVEFMQLHGRRYKIHIDAAIASAAENPSTMRPWQGDSSISIDRFDVRAHLDYIPETKLSADESATSSSDRNSNFERYRILIFNEFEKVAEDKFLKQIFLEENCMTPNVGLSSLIKAEEQKKKKSASQRAAINFNYDNPDAIGEKSVYPARKDADFAEESSDSDYEPEFDKRLDISELTKEQCKVLNSIAMKYGMRANDFQKCMWEDYEEQARIQNLKEIEDERVALAGKQSRRERKLLKEIRIRDRGCVARPLDVLRVDTTDGKKTSHRSRSTDSSSSSSESSSDEENRKIMNTSKKDEIQFITTFGDPAESDNDEKPMRPNAAKQSGQSDSKNGNSFHSKTDKRLQLSRSSSKRASHSHSPLRRRTPTSYRQTRKSRSRSPVSRHYKKLGSNRRRSGSPRRSSPRRYSRRSSNTDGIYLRDSTWPNIRSATVAKRDKSSKTGAEGGNDAILMEVEQKVFDIIECESLGLIELNIRESLSISSPASCKPNDNVTKPNSASQQISEFTNAIRSRDRSKGSRSRSRSRHHQRSSKGHRSPSRSSGRSKRSSTREDRPSSSKLNRDLSSHVANEIVNDYNGRKASIDRGSHRSCTPVVLNTQDNNGSDTDISLPLLSIHSDMSDSEQERRQVENTKRRLKKTKRALKAESKSSAPNRENKKYSSNEKDDKASKPFNALDKLKLQTQKALRKNLAKDKEEERQKQEELRREQELREDEIREISLIMRKRDKEKSEKSPLRSRRRSSSSSSTSDIRVYKIRRSRSRSRR